MSEASSSAVIESQVDWLTVTSYPGELADALRSLGIGIARDQVDRGNVLDQWRWNGYQGWAIEGCQYGSRHDGTIVRLSGATAGAWWWPTVAYADHITRADLCVTVRPDPPRPRLAEDVWAEVCFHEAARGRGRKLRAIFAPDACQTVNVGSRSNPEYGRVYDKEAESRDARYAGAWRFEVEYKAPSASAVVDALVGADAKPEYIAARVANWYEARGVSPRWDYVPGADALAPVRKESDDDRAARWLEHTVRPVVLRLVERRGRMAVLQALGVGSAI